MDLPDGARGSRPSRAQQGRVRRAAAPGRESLLAAVLVFTTTVAAVVSALGAPLVPSIAAELDVPLTTAQWSLTVALLAGAVSAPVLGRLGDGPHRRATLVAGLAAVTVGGAAAALAPDLAWLLAGRALQGIGLGLVPLTMAAARDHLPPERVPATIALLSVCAAGATGAGYPLTGALADAGGLSAAFWAGAAISGLALLAVLAVVPHASATEAPARRLDVLGAGLLTVGLLALLLGVAEGGGRGWTSPAVAGLLSTGAVVLAVWVGQQVRASAPLVEMRLLRSPAVRTGNGVAVVLAVAMYMDLSAVTAFVQAPREGGYGFSATVVVAGLCLVPFAVLSIAASRLLPWLHGLVGARAVLPTGALCVAAGGALFALWHDALWQAFAAMAVVGLGLGLTFAAIPGLLVAAVPAAETGSALGFYQVVRYLGFSLGSALTAALLAAHTAPGQALPFEAGYTTVLWASAAICGAAAVLACVLPARRSGTGGQSGPDRLGVQDARVATAGLVGPDPRG